MSYKTKAEELYKDYYDQLSEFMSNTTTTTKDLNYIGFDLYPIRYLGTFAYDGIPKRFGRNKGFILNLDKKKEINREHWVAIYKYKYKNTNRILFYDSFGRKHVQILPDLKQFYNDTKIEDTELDAEQKKDETDCGLRCMCFLSICYNNGVNYAKYI
jgi:hypothetical protein